MQHPFQRIATVEIGGDDSLLVAACGPSLISLSLKTGEIISEWTADTELSPETNGKPNEEPASISSEPPVKRQKTSEAPAEEPRQAQPTEKKTKQQKKNASLPKSSTIILLCVSPDQSHLAAVTDDKLIRVFSLHPALQEVVTPREMPKRPCSVQISPSNDVILIADKHGDVYSLPLLQTEQIPKQKPEVSKENQFKPSATPLTVHSKRNLNALQAQQAQKQFTPRKDVLGDFENTLLLGHVSMLTDMRFLSLSGEKRQWLATCDRDEHIRISRAPPQAYVIEGFCLGHRAFVSRICQVGARLVSGGGDGWLGIWNFQTMQLERKIDLTKIASEGNVALSGIWQAGGGIAFILEKVDSVFYVPRLDEEAEVRTLSTRGLYPLDLAVVKDKVVVSVDSRGFELSRLQVIDLKTGFSDLELEASMSKLNAHAGKEVVGPSKQLDDFLYSMANLRKRGPLEGDEAAVEDGGAANIEED